MARVYNVAADANARRAGVVSRAYPYADRCSARTVSSEIRTIGGRAGSGRTAALLLTRISGWRKLPAMAVAIPQAPATAREVRARVAVRGGPRPPAAATLRSPQTAATIAADTVSAAAMRCFARNAGSGDDSATIHGV